ncbi:hypothetical protein PMAYCL1PPCAC_05767, partial [Pristionchus mayeri]
QSFTDMIFNPCTPLFGLIILFVNAFNIILNKLDFSKKTSPGSFREKLSMRMIAKGVYSVVHCMNPCSTPPSDTLPSRVLLSVYL